MNNRNKSVSIEFFTNGLTRLAGGGGDAICIGRRVALSGKPTFSVCVGNPETQFPAPIRGAYQNLPYYAIKEILYDMVVGHRIARKGFVDLSLDDILRLGRQIRVNQNAKDSLTVCREVARWKFLKKHGHIPNNDPEAEVLEKIVKGDGSIGTSNDDLDEEPEDVNV